MKSIFQCFLKTSYQLESAEAWKAKRATKKAGALQGGPEAVSDHDNNRSVGDIEFRNERITHTEINLSETRHSIEASFENVMRQLQESISKVDQLLSGKNKENYSAVRNVVTSSWTVRPGSLTGCDTQLPVADDKRNYGSVLEAQKDLAVSLPQIFLSG